MNARRFLFRADSSTEIGSGHVMRCLSLAVALRSRGHVCHFVCRDLSGTIAEKVPAEGFELTLLPTPQNPFNPEPNQVPHAHWAGVDWQQDASQTAAAARAFAPDWIVLDHYGFDANWSRYVTRHGQYKHLIIDDLADRKQHADLLLDQGIARVAADYSGLVNETCQVLAGMQYSVMKPEFARLRDASLARRADAASGRLLLALGGYDPTNLTGVILQTIAGAKPAAIKHIDVVVGLLASHRVALQELCHQMPVASRLHIDTPDMPQLMLNADFAIGGAGLTAIERCVMGLPSIVIVQADNQIEQAKQLHDRNAAIRFDGSPLSQQAEFAQAIEQLCDPTIQRRLSTAAASISDGLGLERLIERIETAGTVQ